VYFDLSAKNPVCCPGGYATHAFLRFNTLDETWQQLFEVHPDRFLAGVDFFARAHPGRAELRHAADGLRPRLIPPVSQSHAAPEMRSA